jgi:uncharacterized protein YegL
MPIPNPLSKVERRKLHFIWLADSSGSMMGEKIQSLNQAVEDALPEVRDADKSNTRAELLFRVLAFSSGARWQVAAPTSAQDFRWQSLSAGGVTDLGAALKLLQQELTADKMGKRNLPPVLVLLSDGAPTDDWEGALEAFNKDGWGKKGRTTRIAIAIGQDADKEVLAKFTGNSELVFEAKNAHQLANLIRWASVTVSNTASIMPPADPDAGGSTAPPPPIPMPPPVDDDDDGDDW